MAHATAPAKGGHKLPARTADARLGELLISKSSSIPLIDLKQFSMRQVLEELDFLKGEVIDPDIDRALATYVSQFIFAPAGMLTRRPSKSADARLANDPVARAGTDVRYHDPDPGDSYACRGGAIHSG